MMFKFVLPLLFLFNIAWAEVGRVEKLAGDDDAYLIRNGQKTILTPEMSLEENDHLFSENTYLVIYLYPSSQLSFGKNTEVKISKNFIEENGTTEKASSVIDFLKGVIRLQVTKESSQEIDQKVQADSVAFAVRGTDFEVSYDGNESVDLDVFEGQVEVTSPHVHTFVPEIVKPNEGFRYSKKGKHFSRRRFSPKFRNHPGFLKRSEIRQKWKTIKEEKQRKKGVSRNVKREKVKMSERREKRKNKK